MKIANTKYKVRRQIDARVFVQKPHGKSNKAYDRTKERRWKPEQEG